ncbi:MAG TPA: hypothetical protein GXX75_06950 [Clostridiales bacterium]|nr:hypothetical protein [Clostridiales bacterium]
MNTYTVIKVHPFNGRETTLGKNLTCAQVAALIGIPAGSASNYARKGAKAKGLYKIIVDGEPRDELADKWNEMCRAARELKRGGRIVVVMIKGKPHKYVKPRERQAV